MPDPDEKDVVIGPSSSNVENIVIGTFIRERAIVIQSPKRHVSVDGLVCKISVLDVESNLLGNDK